MTARWIPRLHYELLWIDREYHVILRGGKHYDQLRGPQADDEAPFRSVARVGHDYDEAVMVLRAMRDTLPKAEQKEAE